MSGRVELALHESLVLADNPLGDAPAREVAVWLPPSYDASRGRRFPAVYVLAGYAGTGRGLLNRQAFTHALDQRLDALVAAGRAAEAVVVLPDCFTRYGGSQYVDSPAIGRWETYLADELVPFVDARFRTIPRREARAVLGKSSGGYGALRLAMRRPELFGAAGSHAGDCAFDQSYAHGFPKTLLTLERRGGVGPFLAWFEGLPAKGGDAFHAMSDLCCSAAWSPATRGPYAFGEGFELPFDPRTGALRPEPWSRWLAADPLRMVDEPRHQEALRGLRALYLDAGLSDEFNLQLGARQLAAKLTAAGVPVLHEEFDGGHGNTPFRYDRSFEVLTRALVAE